MTVERDDLNGAEHDNQPTHKLEDVQVYKVDLVKRPATGDSFLAVRSADTDEGNQTMPKRRAMSTQQFRQQYRKTDGESVTIAQRGDPVGEEPKQAGAAPETEDTDPTVAEPEQGVQRESNEKQEGDQMTKEMLERMDALTATVGALVERMAPEAAPAPEAEATPEAAPAPEADATAPEAATETPATEAAATPEPEATAAPAPEADATAPEPEATAPEAEPATTDAPAVDTAAVERMTASLESVVTTMEGVTRGVVATGEAVAAMGTRVTTMAETVTTLTERMDSVERGMSTSNAQPQDETETEPGDKVQRSEGGSVFRGLLFGQRAK